MFWLTIHVFLLVLVAFVVGAILGCMLRRRMAGSRPQQGAAETKSVAEIVAPVAQPTPEPAAPVEEPVSEGKPPTPEPDEDEAVVEAAAPPVDAEKAEKTDMAGRKPVVLDAPRDGKADDLKRIRGIGRVNEGKLNALGIYHFDQIAGWGEDEIRWVQGTLVFAGRVEREDWVGQAKKLAAGQT